MRASKLPISGWTLGKLRGAADNMSIIERQKVLRLVVKEVLIDDDNIRVKHSIPIPRANMPTGLTTETEVESYLLRKGGVVTAFGQYRSR